MNAINGYLSSTSTSAKIGLAVGAGLILLMTAVAIWWVLAPRDQLLFGNLRQADAAEIVQSLNEWKVPHTIVDGGAGISVPENAVYQTRMRLVSAGVPRGGHVGFELFDDSDFGVTEFAQRVNYQRALTGEIERTIAALPGVDTARVHLTIRRPGLFVGKDESSKASVAVTLVPGESLDRRQISGIRSLVAAAVEGLSAEAVSIVGSDGELLAAPGAGHAAAGLGERADDERQLEQELQARLVQLLGQYFSREEFEVSVDASLNFDTVHEVSQRPIAAVGGAVLRRKVTNGSGAELDDSTGREEIEYAHGTTRQEVSRAPGRIERLSVAVVLPPNLDELKVSRVQSLVAAAVGFDEARGDRLEVLRFARGDSVAALPATAPAIARESAPIAIDPLPQSPELTQQRWFRWWLAAAAGLLLGVVVSVAMQRRPRRLEPQEREAVLARMRGWLAEGSAEA